MSRSRTVQAREKDRHLTVSDHETDSPILPIAQLERLKEIAPDRVDWVFEETGREGQYRRNETRRLNTLVFIEHLIGNLAGLVIGASSLVASYWLAVAGHDAVAIVIGGTTVVGLVSVFVYGVRRNAGRRGE